jgi:adenylate cyclase
MAAVAGLSVGAVVAVKSAGILRDAELQSLDVRFRLRGAQVARRDVIVVGVDPNTVSRLNRRPPYPRSLHARMIDLLHRAGARVIAYDVQFVGTSTPREDNALIAAVKRARPMVLATHDVNGPPLRIPAGVRDAGRIGAVLGSVGVPTDSDGELRRMFYAPVDILAFDVVTANMALGHRVSERNFRGDYAWVDFAGPPRTIPTYSFYDVLVGRVPARAFAGKVVIVGYTDPSLPNGDVFNTPVSDNLMSGPEVHANTLDTILGGFPLRPASGWLGVLLLIGSAVLTPLISVFRRTGWMLLGAGLGLALLVVTLQGSFDLGWILNATEPTLALSLSTIGAVACGYLLETRDRRRQRLIFTRFVPRDVVDDVIERTDDDLRLGAVRRDGTVIFTDLRGFTTFAERLEPEQVVAVVNQYLSEMTEAILGHGGTLVSYMGDGIMALFGAPLEQADHADRAVRAVRDMLRVRLPRFNRWLAANGFERSFRMGIGVNSGLVMSGNVGSLERMEYTALGDTTNTAARLEGMTKDTAHQALIADATRQRLKDDAADLIELGEAPVRGRSTGIKLWTLLESQDSGGPEPPVGDPSKLERTVD